MDGKSNEQIVSDSFESIYDNGGRIVGFIPATKIVGVGATHCLNTHIFSESQSLSTTLKSTGGKVVPYLFVTYAWFKTIQSSLSEDPVACAEKREYVLK